MPVSGFALPLCRTKVMPPSLPGHRTLTPKSTNSNHGKAAWPAKHVALQELEQGRHEQRAVRGHTLREERHG